MANNNSTKAARSGMRIFLGVAACLGFFGPLAWLMTKGMATMSKEMTLLFGNMMGVGMALIKETFSYYYGSSMKEAEAPVTVGPPPDTEV